MKEALTQYLNEENVFGIQLKSGKTLKEDSGKIKSYKVMGLVIHELGDIYAHRVLLKKGDEIQIQQTAVAIKKRYKIPKSKHFFDNWSDFLTKIDGITTSGIKSYMVVFENITEVRRNQVFEDNIDFISERYTKTESGVKLLISRNGKYNYAATDVTGNIDKIINAVIAHGGTFKLHKLADYLK